MKNAIIIVGVLVMIGMIEFSFTTPVIEASPMSMQQKDDQEQDRGEAERIENERHEQAMKRRPNESEQEWHERQQRENERHERRLWAIAHAFLP